MLIVKKRKTKRSEIENVGNLPLLLCNLKLRSFFDKKVVNFKVKAACLPVTVKFWTHTFTIICKKILRKHFCILLATVFILLVKIACRQYITKLRFAPSFHSFGIPIPTVMFWFLIKIAIPRFYADCKRKIFLIRKEWTNVAPYWGSVRPCGRMSFFLS